MHRIQVQLTEEQERRLRDLAQLRGGSISSLIREGIDHVLEPHPDPRDNRLRAAMSIVGIVDDRAKAAEEHDRNLADVYAENQPASDP